MISVLRLFGSILVLAGTVGFFFFTSGLRMGIKKVINLDENGFIFPQYMQPPVTPTSSFYLFAIKNRNQFLQGKKVSFTLKGPYKFNVLLIRKEIKFSSDKERVAFVWGRQLIWNEAESRNPDEEMWTLNPVLPSVIITVRSLLKDRIPLRRISEPLVYNSLNMLLNYYGERLFERATPRRLLDGRTVGLLDDFVRLAKRFGVSSLLPPTPPDNVFGFIYVQNRTFFDMELWTGLGQTRSKFAEVSKFRGKDRLDMWEGRCNSITGTNGELFKPFLIPGKQIRVFLASLCRSFDMDPLGTDLVRTKSGVMALEYEFGRGLFQGARSNPDNKCFCTEKRSFDCQYDGLVSMGPCFYDAPLYLSRTNFRDVDSKISNLIDWRSASMLNETVEPNQQTPSKQIFRIEPISGGVLEVDISMMATIKVIKQPHVRDLANVQNLTYMPLLINHDVISLPYGLVWQLYYLQMFNDYHRPIMAGMVGLGLGAMALKFLLGTFQRRI